MMTFPVAGSRQLPSFNVFDMGGDTDDVADDAFEGAERPDGFLENYTDDGSSDDDDAIDAGSADEPDSSVAPRFTAAGLVIAVLAALLSALSLTVSVATYLRPAAQAKMLGHVSDAPGSSCASGQALLAWTRTTPAQEGAMAKVCVAEPVRWEALPDGDKSAVCARGGIRVALESGGTAKLCGVGRDPPDAQAAAAAAASNNGALKTNFLADSPIRVGQVVALSAKGGVSPYQPFRHVVWEQTCSFADAVGVGSNTFVSRCSSAAADDRGVAKGVDKGAGEQDSLLKLCSVRSDDTVSCGRAVSGLAPAARVHERMHSSSPASRVLLAVGGPSRLLILSTESGELIAGVFDSHEASLTLTATARGRVPLQIPEGPAASWPKLTAVFVSRSQFAVAVARTHSAGGSGGEGEGAGAGVDWAMCSIENQTTIHCGEAAAGPTRSGLIVDLKLVALERDRLALASLVLLDKAEAPEAPAAGDVGAAGRGRDLGGRESRQRVDVGVLHRNGGVGGAGTQEGGYMNLWLSGVSTLRAGLGRPLGDPLEIGGGKMDLLVLSPSRLLITWPVLGGGVDAVVAKVADGASLSSEHAATANGEQGRGASETLLSFSPITSLLPPIVNAEASDRGEATRVWTCWLRQPASVAVIAMFTRSSVATSPGVRASGSSKWGVVGQGEGQIWQIQVKLGRTDSSSPTQAPASFASAAPAPSPATEAAEAADGGRLLQSHPASSSSFTLQVMGVPERIWRDVPPLALAGAAAVAVTPNRVVSLVAAGRWVAVRTTMASAAAVAAGPWEQELLARPLGVAVTQAARGAQVTVAMSGAVDVFAGLVPGCRYVVDPDGSLRCGQDDGAVGAREWGAQDAANADMAVPLGRAVSASVMILAGLL